MRPNIVLAFLLILSASASQADPPDTGISGVYEVMTGVRDTAETVIYFEQFGFRVVGEASLSREERENQPAWRWSPANWRVPWS